MTIVTISREFGAGGRTIGQMVADRMGFTFFDNELIQKVADKAKVSTEGVVSLEKEAAGKFQKMISGMIPKRMVDMVRENKVETIDEEVYVDLLTDIIRDIADEDNAVIIGRGSQYILEGRKNVFNILIVADKKDRVNFMRENYNLTYDQAVKTVELDDKRRINLYRVFNKTDFNRAERYHLVVNTSKMSIETAAELIVELMQEK